jgi:hypothetical protein
MEKMQLRWKIWVPEQYATSGACFLTLHLHKSNENLKGIFYIVTQINLTNYVLRVMCYKNVFQIFVTFIQIFDTFIQMLKKLRNKSQPSFRQTLDCSFFTLKISDTR